MTFRWAIVLSLAVALSGCLGSGQTPDYVVAAIDLANRVNQILNQQSAFAAVPAADWAKVSELYREALAEGRRASIDQMNEHVPEFGNR
ncbi:MAG: hypothetical protein WD645_03160, partial [Dehalococcoidia bacterium]